MEHNVSHTPLEMARLLLTISIVASDLAEELLEKEAPESEAQRPTIERRRRPLRPAHPTNDNDDWREKHGSLV